MVARAWALSATILGPVRGLLGLVRHADDRFVVLAAEKNLQRYITYILIDFATLGPLGASGLATYEMVDVKLHVPSILFIPSRRFSILILCQ